MQTENAKAALKQIRATKGMSARIARELGISRQAVSDWDEIPVVHMIVVEEITGIPRERLRPDLFVRKKRKRKKA